METRHHVSSPLDWVTLGLLISPVPNPELSAPDLLGDLIWFHVLDIWRSTFGLADDLSGSNRLSIHLDVPNFDLWGHGATGRNLSPPDGLLHMEGREYRYALNQSCPHRKSVPASSVLHPRTFLTVCPPVGGIFGYAKGVR